MSGDLDQVSFARKLIVALVAIVVLAAVAWLAFRGGALLRGSPEPGDGAPAETPVETAPPR